jgi:hypothetical protein
MCGTGLAERHGHVVDTDRRVLVCACRPCFLLFAADGAGGGRFRAVPERVRHDPAHPLSGADWDCLDIPADTAFLFRNSALGRIIACYPSPAGATECELDLAAWDRLGQRYPLLREPVADLEAVLVSRTATGVEAYLLPIDACFALVGEIRLRWRGLDGGDEVRTALDTFLADLRARSVPLPAEG